MATGSPKCALVIAADICLYAPGPHPAEITQGAGAVAMIVGQDKFALSTFVLIRIVSLALTFGALLVKPFPNVDSAKSLTSYLIAAKNCFQSLF